MKLYKHEWMWHYIGSCAIVIAENPVGAKEIIRELLDKSGLKYEEIELTEIDIIKGATVYFADWDY